MRSYALAYVSTDFRVFSYEKRGEGGIRTLGSLLSYGALAKRCFQPLSHLTKCRAGISRRIADCQYQYLDLQMSWGHNIKSVALRVLHEML